MAPKPKTSNNPLRLWIILGTVISVGVIVLALIAFQLLSSGGTIDYTGVPMERTADGAFVLGNPEAAVTIVAFEDFLCPHCQNYEPVIKDFLREYVLTGQARFEFRMLPISQQSPVVFQLAECADILEPGSFWEAHDTLFQITSTQRFDDRLFAQRIDMSYGDLLECVASGEADQYVVDATLANDSGGRISGTPSVAWRLNGGPLRFDTISRRPSAREMGALVQFYSIPR